MVATPESNIVLSNQEFNVVGTRPIRHDGAEKVTGRARYSADINLPGMLYAKVLRSPHAHARIKAIDTSKAEALSGVKAVVTSAELPQPTGVLTEVGESAMVNPKFLSNNCLATDKALYKGHAVAAVAATSVHIAEQALALIEVDYEVLPSVTDILDAMKDDAPVLHERLANMANPNVRPGGLRDEGDGTKSTNIANHFFFEAGDIEQGFKDADVIVEREFRTQSVHQGYIEPHSATADWGPDGNLTVWCSSHYARYWRLRHKGGTHGDWRRLWRQDAGLLGAGGGTLVPQGRTAGEVEYEPFRGIPELWPNLRKLDEMQIGRHERRTYHCG